MYLPTRLQRGLAEYLRVFRLFSPNVRSVMVYAVFEGLVFGVFQLIFNFYVLSLGGYDNSFIGNLVSASSFASLLVAVPAAFVAGKFPARSILIVSGIVSALSLFGVVVLPYRAALIALNILSGLAVSFRQVALFPFLMSNTGEGERQYVFSFQFGLGLVAQFAGNMLGGSLPLWLGGLILVEATSAAAYQMAIGSMSFVALAAVIPLLFIQRNVAKGQETPPLPWRKLPKYAGQIAKLLASPFAIGLGAGLMVPFMNIYFRNVYNKSDATIGLVVGVSVLGMGIAQFIAPPMAKSIGKINTVMLTQGLSIPFLILLGVGGYIVPAGLGSREIWFAVAAFAFFMRLSLMNLSGPVYQTFILERVEREAMALTTSLFGMSFTIGWFISPSISGWLQDTYAPFGFVPVFTITSITYVVGTFLLWLFFRNAEKAVPPDVGTSDGALAGAK